MTTDEILQALRAECPIPSGSRRTRTTCRRGYSACCPSLACHWTTPRCTSCPGCLRPVCRAALPEATEADLRPLAALFTWFFLVDDACDGPDRLVPEQIRALSSGTLALLHGGPGCVRPG
ncbi:hypothetical protein NKG94_33620 [Micromonospora sp. M12]